MISVSKMTYLLSNIAPFRIKVKLDSEFRRKKPAGLYGQTGKEYDGKKETDEKRRNDGASAAHR